MCAMCSYSIELAGPTRENVLWIDQRHHGGPVLGHTHNLITGVEVRTKID